MECVRDFTKGFSLIDIFAFLVPGTLFLLFSMPLWGTAMVDAFFAPIQLAFGDTVWLRVAYLLTLGYVLGFLFSEAGKLLGKLARGCHKQKSEDAAVQEQKAAAKEAAIERNKVFPTAELYRKAQLFKGFSQFCRSTAIVAALLALEIWWKCGMGLQRGLICLAVVIVLEILLYVRARRFEEYSRNYLEFCRRSILYHDGMEKTD